MDKNYSERSKASKESPNRFRKIRNSDMGPSTHSGRNKYSKSNRKYIYFYLTSIVISSKNYSLANQGPFVSPKEFVPVTDA
jgi:hypothetical protein